MDWSLTLSILSIILVIPLGIVTNLLTPKIVDWYSNFSEIRIIKRTIALEEELDKRKKLRENTNKLLSFGILSTLKALIYFLIINLTNYYLLSLSTLFASQELKTFQKTAYFALTVLCYIVFVLVSRDFKIIKDVYKFEQYEQKIQDRIKVLESKLSTKKKIS